jgi:hypothetical protein
MSLATRSANAPQQQTEEHHGEVSGSSSPVTAALDAGGTRETRNI